MTTKWPRLRAAALGAGFAWCAAAIGCSEGDGDAGGTDPLVDGSASDSKGWPDGATGGAGGSTSQSCGQLAQQMGWANAFCEWNNNRACNGLGTETSDCDHCCNANPGSGGAAGAGGTAGAGGVAGSGGSVPGVFGYPVGDKSTSPAGGWMVWQVMSHYYDSYGGRHLAQDVSLPGGDDAIDAPIYAISDGVVRYAKSNTSAYRNVLLIEHEVGDGSKVCSFFGHINPPLVTRDEVVTRGQQVATVLNWADAVTDGDPGNTHLHYVLVSEALCDFAAPQAGSGVCGYDKGNDTGLGKEDLASEPYFYTAENDDCGGHQFADGFISPTKFIDDHHF